MIKGTRLKAETQSTSIFSNNLGESNSTSLFSLPKHIESTNV